MTKINSNSNSNSILASKTKFKLIMLSAMYENGGNTTQRLLDGHENLFVYPFESQLGSKLVVDNLSSLFPIKYRWPVFSNSITPEEAYRAIIDEEGKVRSKTPYVSKFRDADFNLLDSDRQKYFVKYLEGKELTRKNFIEAFFVSTFKAWKNFNSSSKEKYYVGYSPIIGVDSEKMIKDFKNNIQILHIIRNPFSAYADTKKRAVPMSLSDYTFAWSVCQYYALLFSQKYPKNFTYLRYEDIIQNPKKVLGNFLKKLGLKSSNTLDYVSWNGNELTEVYPWGTIRVPSEKVNIETAKELSTNEISEIYLRTEEYIKKLNFQEIYKQLKK